jgi:hypothetical protein
MTSYTDGDAKWFFGHVPVTAGQQYTLKDRYSSNVETYATIQYVKTDGTSSYAYQGALASTGGVWQSLERTITVPADAVSMTLFHVIGSVGFLTVDDYSLRQVGAVQEYVNPSQVLAFQAAGHEVGGHTRTHPDLTTLSTAEKQSQIAGSRADLQGMGVTSPNMFVYPYGAYDDEIKQITEGTGWLGARSVERGYNTPLSDKYVLKMQGVYRDTTLGEIQNWINQASANKAWLILMFHEIDTDPAHPFATSPAILQSTINYLGTANVDVVTMGQGLGQLNP